MVKQLAPMQDSGLISAWHDNMIAFGDDWDKAINQELNNSEVIVFMVSPDLYSSAYIRRVELPRAIERQELNEAIIIPLFVRHLIIEGTKFGSLQGFPTGTDEHPFLSDYPNRDKALFGAALCIRKKIKSMTENS